MVQSINDNQRQSVQSIARACALLEALAHQPGASLGKLSRDVGLHPATAHRLLHTLQDLGYVYHAGPATSYHLGPNLMWLGRQAAVQFPFREATRAEMHLLVEQCAETAYTAVLRDEEVLYVDVVDSPHTIRITSQIGDRCPAHTTATGRVLLSFLSPADLKHYLARELCASTPYSVTDPEQLAQLIREARRQSYSVVVDEQEVGVTSIAAPILGPDGSALAALAISGPTYRMSGRTSELIRLAIEFAKRMSLRVGQKNHASRAAAPSPV